MVNCILTFKVLKAKAGHFCPFCVIPVKRRLSARGGQAPLAEGPNPETSLSLA